MSTAEALARLARGSNRYASKENVPDNPKENVDARFRASTMTAADAGVLFGVDRNRFYEAGFVRKEGAAEDRDESQRPGDQSGGQNQSDIAAGA
jgi:hypothetical protein